MHIPDGYLDLSISLLLWILSGAVLGYSLKKVADSKNINTPLIGVISAAVFAAQMLNWPIPGGTSAHFVGGSLAGILLGPYAGSIAMASVVAIQAFLYGDGGLIALGANLWNMSVVNVFAGWYIFRLIEKHNRFAAAFTSGWIGITAAAVFVGLEVGLSSAFKYSAVVAVSAMGLWHGSLGLIEGFITAGVVGYIHSNRPDIEKYGEAESFGRLPLAIVGIMIILSPVFAYLAEMVGYSEPLENVAEELGLRENQKYSGLFPDYTVPGMNDYIGTLISGAVGVMIFLSLALMRRYAPAD